MSDLVDRISTVERSLQGSPYPWIGPNSEKFNTSGARLDGQRALHSSFDHPSSPAMERSKTAKSSNLPPPTAVPLCRSLRLKMKQNPASYRTDSRLLNSPVEEEEEEGEVGFRPLKVIGRPVDKGSVNTTQGQRWSVLEVGE